jgi:hypothetical protein
MKFKQNGNETYLFDHGPPRFMSCLVLQCTCSYLPYPEAVSSILNLRMVHTEVTKYPLDIHDFVSRAYFRT